MRRFLAFLLVTGLLLGLTGAAGVLGLFWYYGRDLPRYDQLADYEPPTTTRIHAGDGRLIAEYASERRVFVPIEAMPKLVVKAFLAAEDKNFYSHPGVNPFSVVRAAITNIRRLGSDQRPVGASTITQQVAKNFLLTNEVSVERKIKEAILALRMERALGKDRILELYLNEIFLGFRSFGVAAAALNYFGKSMDDLKLEEAAFLAALPKAPNNYHPRRHPQAALERRNWVIGRMAAEDLVTEEEAAVARDRPLTIRPSVAILADSNADWFAEEVRRALADSYSEATLYEGGLSVRTSLDPRLQAIADRTLRDGLEAYDRRHGWRGPLTRLDGGADWRVALAGMNQPGLPPDWRLAAVLAVTPDSAEIGLVGGRTATIPWAEMAWARPWRVGQRVGPAPAAPLDVLAVGDVVAVEPLAGTDVAADDGTDGETLATRFSLRQVPSIDGGLVALDPHTGRVLAITGGYSFGRSQFNRVTQAARQPGSAFKPFVYLAALEAGLSPATMVLDAPFVIDQGAGQGLWKPSNYTQEFYGPSPMRLGIEKSRNLMTVRLAQTIGMDRVAGVAERFGVVDDLPELLAMSLGSAETSLLRLTSAYAMLVNGGRRITPSVIDRVQDRHGRTVFRHDSRDCACGAGTLNGGVPPPLPDPRQRVADPVSAYQIVSMLQGVVKRGTGVRIDAVGKPLAGKTGTTNDGRDTWFVGFSPDLAVGVYIGFDKPESLGPRETGSSVAVPVFRDFMAAVLDGQPAIPFRVPPGVRLVWVDTATGQPTGGSRQGAILEAFREGAVPTSAGAVIDGGVPADATAPATGTGGLY